MDALAAHLDRGWDLLKKNDARGAEISARKALDLAPDDPEALTLLGAIATAEGDDEGALEHFQAAMDADPEFVTPMLYAAEVHLEPDGDHDEALRLIDEALDHAEEEDEYLDALLLKAEALVLAERDDEARRTLDELPPVAFPDSSFDLRAARLYLDLGELGKAEEHYQKVLAVDENDADAWHGLGLVHEDRDDLQGMVKAWLRVREIDLEQDPVPWALSQEDFEAVAEAALAELPDKIRTLLANVPILAADYPSVEVVAEGYDPRMMGFFSGVPYPEKTHATGTSPHLDTVFLYKRNIEEACRNREETVEEVKKTLLHETGHFFGLSEEDLERMGLG